MQNHAVAMFASHISPEAVAMIKFPYTILSCINDFSSHDVESKLKYEVKVLVSYLLYVHFVEVRDASYHAWRTENCRDPIG